jgi:hypothetical protein
MREKTWTMIAVAACIALVWTAAALAAQEAPEQMTLDSLSDIYEPVKFDHAAHVGLADNCASCHHHTTGEASGDKRCAKCHKGGEKTANVSCHGCHSAEPFSASTIRGLDEGRYHYDKPGLKGAYHLSCLGCHRSMGGPTACDECHKRSAAGEAIYRTSVVGGTAKGH